MITIAQRVEITAENELKGRRGIVRSMELAGKMAVVQLDGMEEWLEIPLTDLRKETAG